MKGDSTFSLLDCFGMACHTTGCCCVHDACACACRLLIDTRAGCDDVTAVVMTTVVGVACLVLGALAGALVSGAICRRRPAHYIVSRTSTPSTRVLPLPLPSPDSSMDTDDVFLPASARRQLTVADASFKRQLMLKSTESFRSTRTKLDSNRTASSSS